jgi:hypothetical protein
MKQSGLKQTDMQRKYREENPFCEICGRFPGHVHHINHRHSDDREDNFVTLCPQHHTFGQNCPHRGSELLFIEQNRLYVNPKWHERYRMLKGKQGYQAEIKKIYGTETMQC